MKSFFLLTGLMLPLAVQAQNTITVQSTEQLRAALRNVKAGQTIRIAPGEYDGSVHAENLRGTTEKPIVIAGDAQNPPLFKGGGGWHISGAEHLEFRDLKIEGARSNGLNLDDGGVYTRPSRYITLKSLQISDIGPRGNHDGIKLSGVDDFQILNCRIENWGVGSGSGIDMVGCHQGVISGNTFLHRSDPRDTGGSGVQAKGGCRANKILKNRFENAGQRAINIGGSTGLEFFRPPLNDLAQWPDGKHEARNITVEGNVFVGGLAPLAFVGVDGALVRFNTIYHPGRWAMRILQETTEPGFVPSRGGVFSDNIVVFRAGEWAEGGVNIGAKTAPETFAFARNLWFCEDNPQRSRPTLPAPEKEGIYGQDPLFKNAPQDFSVPQGSPAFEKGASGWAGTVEQK